MLWQQELTKVVWLREVILVVVLDFFLHVVLEALRIFCHEFFEDQVDLHKLTSWSSLEWLFSVVTVNIYKVSLKASYDFSLHNDIHINLIFEFFKGLVLGSLFSSLSTPLFSQFILLDCLNFIEFSFLNFIVLSLNDGSMLILAFENSINHNILRAFNSSLILFEEISDSAH